MYPCRCSKNSISCIATRVSGLRVFGYLGLFKNEPLWNDHLQMGLNLEVAMRWVVGTELFWQNETVTKASKYICIIIYIRFFFHFYMLFLIYLYLILYTYINLYLYKYIYISILIYIYTYICCAWLYGTRFCYCLDESLCPKFLDNGQQHMHLLHLLWAFWPHLSLRHFS